MEQYSFEEALCALSDLICDESEEMRHFYIAIDGPSGSGKSTLADHLAKELGAPVIRMDDFYLPLAEREGARIAAPGWNVDYERFTREIAKNALARKPITYGIFDCASQSIRETVSLPPSRYLIVEGCYAMHPEIPDFYDLRIVVTAERETCEKRILDRDGAAVLERFRREWFPLEDAYLEAYMIRELCDVTVLSDDALKPLGGASFRGFEMDL